MMLMRVAIVCTVAPAIHTALHKVRALLLRALPMFSRFQVVSQQLQRRTAAPAKIGEDRPVDGRSWIGHTVGLGGRMVGS
ncbi:hypothetical protein F5Y14DRAFT_404295 [Nemania sp. NC0429]|nr:hypothetical protein F5Y14DRAFT_404295 [Nemania sp. NC0429]